MIKICARFIYGIALVFSLGCAHTGLLGSDVITNDQFISSFPGSEGEFIRIDYNLLSFKKNESEETFPLILSFHGTGDSNGEYISKWLPEAKRNRVMILTPNRKKAFHQDQNNPDAMLELLESITRRYPVDPTRIYLSGISSGAMAARKMFVTDPNRWAGIIYLAKFGSSKWIENSEVSVWPPMLYAVGLLDQQAPLDKLDAEIEALRKLNPRVTFLKDEYAGHEHAQRWNAFIFKWLNHPGGSYDYLLGDQSKASAPSSA